jgi:GT2 family glycosyltransferase
MVPVIIIPVLNRYDLLERCLQSIDYPVEHLIIVDNGGESSLQFYPWVIDRRLVSNYHVWSMPTNLGVAPSWNLGIKATPHARGWILLNSDAWFKPGQLEDFFAGCDDGKVVRTKRNWSCVWVGQDVVSKIGLFSECYVPAYFEDNDYEQRAKAFNISVVVSDVEVEHDNSSTLKANPAFGEKNNRSFADNSNLHDMRWRSGIPDAGAWDLGRRRTLGWD